jgi:hypothetical protein
MFKLALLWDGFLPVPPVFLFLRLHVALATEFRSLGWYTWVFWASEKINFGSSPFFCSILFCVEVRKGKGDEYIATIFGLFGILEAFLVLLRIYVDVIYVQRTLVDVEDVSLAWSTYVAERSQVWMYTVYVLLPCNALATHTRAFRSPTRCASCGRNPSCP